MDIKLTEAKDLIQIDPDVFRDNRGFFLESCNNLRYNELEIELDFVKDNHSRSYRNILRGLHYQINNPQAQIINEKNIGDWSHWIYRASCITNAFGQRI